MRKLKFRCWGADNDNPKGKMYYPGDHPFVLTLFGDPINAPNGVPIDRCCFMRVGWNDACVMQYTGLKDKNGKEVYEGDLIKGGIYKMYEVEWDQEANGWNIDPYAMNHGDFEIIGHKYESPELLETKEG